MRKFILLLSFMSLFGFLNKVAAQSGGAGSSNGIIHFFDASDNDSLGIVFVGDTGGSTPKLILQIEKTDNSMFAATSNQNPFTGANVFSGVRAGTIGMLTQFNNSGGGIVFSGFSDDATVSAMTIEGYHSTATSTNAPTIFRSFGYDGANQREALASTEKAFSFFNESSEVMTFYGDGAFVPGAASNPADAGVMRLDNGDLLAWEASPAGTDVSLTVDASEIMQIAGGSLDGDDVEAASVTVRGTSELATAAETTTGTDATRALTPDGFAGSDYGKKVIPVLITLDYDTDTAVGDGKAFYVFDPIYAGWDLVSVSAAVITAGTTNTTDLMIHNLTAGANVLSTIITIDSGEKNTSAAATPAVIDTGQDDITAFDEYRFDIDAVSTTAAKGLILLMVIQKP